ncbi:MAG: hypothetical protein ACPGJS_12625 [Flammeovirgaceae bacterium]
MKSRYRFGVLFFIPLLLILSSCSSKIDTREYSYNELVQMGFEPDNFVDNVLSKYIYGNDYGGCEQTYFFDTNKVNLFYSELKFEGIVDTTEAQKTLVDIGITIVNPFVPLEKDLFYHIKGISEYNDSIYGMYYPGIQKLELRFMPNSKNSIYLDGYKK